MKTVKELVEERIAYIQRQIKINTKIPNNVDKERLNYINYVSPNISERLSVQLDTLLSLLEDNLPATTSGFFPPIGDYVYISKGGDYFDFKIKEFKLKQNSYGAEYEVAVIEWLAPKYEKERFQEVECGFFIGTAIVKKESLTLQ